MNPESPTPPPVPMVKEETVKEDGRILIYYTFPPEAPPAPDNGGAGRSAVTSPAPPLSGAGGPLRGEEGPHV